MFFEGDGGAVGVGGEDLLAFGEGNVVVAFSVALYVDVVDALAGFDGFGKFDVSVVFLWSFVIFHIKYE